MMQESSLVAKGIYLLISNKFAKAVQTLLLKGKEFDTLLTAVFRVNRIKGI